ncbi:hypothetical protein [Rhodopila sp.]|uniref:hypothetical protein n=1 Tax=Rhodopila sp. TaxID=2480087 RepID=UPI002C839BD7|nr:hypothetical protein [Rhodopila sp.]HVZ06856.1 hypothetical protein [Rhodopila sp.]
MKTLTHTALGGLAAVLISIGAAAAKPTSEARPAHAFPRLSTTDGAPVEMAPHPGSPADGIARRLMAREIEHAKASGPAPVVLVAMARLNDQDELLFVQLQSSSECGSAGCSIMAFKYVDGDWVRTVDTVGGMVRIATSRHRGMPDLIVNHSRLVWNGARYVDLG